MGSYGIRNGNLFVDMYGMGMDDYIFRRNMMRALDAAKYKQFTPSSIANVEFYPPAVKMTFTDGTVVTAVAQEDDEFDPEIGMQTCIMKYIFGDNTYNNMFRKWIKKDEERKAAKAKEEALAEEQREIKKRQAEKAARRKAARRERQIEIQKEAYLRAMKEANA